MPRKIQICPHCGASISGNPQQCPRCDGLLPVIPQSIAELGPIGPETEEMISSLSMTPVAPVPTDPIEDEHEDDVVLWRPSDGSKVSNGPPEDSSAEAGIDPSQAVQETSEAIGAENSDVGVEIEETQADEPAVVEPEVMASDNAGHDELWMADGEATSFDIVVEADSEDEAELGEDNDVEDVDEVEFDEERETAPIEDGSWIEPIISVDVTAENAHVEGEDVDYTDGEVEHVDETDKYVEADTSPQVAVPAEWVEDTQNHIEVDAGEPSSPKMTDEERAAFENAETAIIPAEEIPPQEIPLEEVPMMAAPIQAHPRPAEPVPEPTPLPLLSAMDTEPKVVIPEAPPIPPAPFTPPPPIPVAPLPSAFPVQAPPQYQGWQGQPANYWLQQRIQAYLYGGYRMREQRLTETTMAYGKPISFFWWVVAVMSGVGLLWYLFILMLSGFRKDIVYIYLEHDGYVYEEGPGAAHIRRRRSRVARRWGVIGLLLAIFSAFTIIIMVVSIVILMNRYEAELASAYPESSFIQGNVNTENLDETQVQNVKVVVPVIVIMSAMSMVGFVGGLSMSLISYLHSNAYHVDVAPLPDLR